MGKYIFLWSEAFYLVHLYCNIMPELTTYCQNPHIPPAFLLQTLVLMFLVLRK